MIVRQLVTKLGFDSKEAEKNIKSIDKKTMSLKDSLKSVTIAMTAWRASLFAIAKNTADYTDTLQKMADRMGFSVEMIESMRYSAQLAGIAVAAIDNSLTFLNINLGKARDGVGIFGEVFKSLGVDVVSAQGRLKKTDQVLYEVIDALGKIDDAAIRSGRAMLLFGRSGKDMGALWGQGLEEIKKQREELLSLDGIVSENTIKESVNFQDNMLRATTIIKGLKREIGGGLLPVMNKLLVSFKDWYIQNRILIRQNLNSFINETRQNLMNAADNVKVLLEIANKIVNFLFGDWGRAWRFAKSAMIAFIATKGVIEFFKILNSTVKTNAFFLFVLAFSSFVDDWDAWSKGAPSVLGDIFGPYDKKMKEWKKDLKDVYNWLVKIRDFWKPKLEFPQNINEFYKQRANKLNTWYGVGAPTFERPYSPTSVQVNVDMKVEAAKRQKMVKEIAKSVVNTIERFTLTDAITEYPATVGKVTIGR